MTQDKVNQCSRCKKFFSDNEYLETGLCEECDLIEEELLEEGYKIQRILDLVEFGYKQCEIGTPLNMVLDTLKDKEVLKFLDAFYE